MDEATTPVIVKVYSASVLIRGPEGEYVDSEDNYQVDAGKPFPPLPGQAIGRTYIPNEKHTLYLGRKAEPEGLPWVPGDRILDDLQTLLDNQATRQAVTPRPPETLDALRLAAIDALMDENVAAGSASRAVLDYVAARDR